MQRIEKKVKNRKKYEKKYNKKEKTCLIAIIRLFGWLSHAVRTWKTYQ